ncbi:UDP-N-acetylmuramoyl-L-alanyl-D-glutamate--2,6-diaminopimelate ligase [Phycisphaeraceae bacterium D3-23]
MLPADLIARLPITRAAGPGDDVAVADLTDDSRRVVPGGLFVCRGPVDDRAAGFIEQAIAGGASAVLTQAVCGEALPIVIPDRVVHLVADDGDVVDQRLAGQLAERFFDQPASKLRLIGITGTNGKTTTATITQHLLRATGEACGLLGTVHVDTGHADGPRAAELTTPGAIELSRLLAEMVANGCTCAVMEVSSHALHQGRADHLRFAAAGFTNLTQDHLDYHGTMADYADAKALLFESLDADATAVLNGDDATSKRMAQDCKAGVVTTHVTNDSRTMDDACSPSVCSAYALVTELFASHSRARFVGPWGDVEAVLPLVGPHNLANAIQAAALAHAVTGIEAERLRTALDACPPVPGRLESVGSDWPEVVSTRDSKHSPAVLVDYAHTPDALQNVAAALRSLTAQDGRLIIVFGCGGDRDRAKRPLMAQAACRYADVVVLTSDNPRTEYPQQILDDAQTGFAQAEAAREVRPETHIEIDRAKAICLAIELATPIDTVLIAGKGHEDYQVLGTAKVHFDDREHAAAALRARQSAKPHA